MTHALSRAVAGPIAALVMLAVLPAVAGAGPVAPVSTNVGCDPLDAAACLLPFPNDFFTEADASAATGRRLDFSLGEMPRNGTEATEGGEGKPVDPAEWNRNDGFSPGSMVMTYVRGLDLHATWGTQDRPFSEVGPNEPGYFDHRDHIADIGLYQRDDAPIVILNAETGERHPFWSELDTHPDAIDAGEQVLILRPASNFEEGARYVVALRDLRTSDGSVIEAGPEFAAYQSGNGEDDRQTHFDEDIFPVLEQAGIARDNLYLAWDFTVASERNLAERALHIRDDAFEKLGDTELADGIVGGESPEFVVDRTEERTDTWRDSHGVEHTQRLRRIHGRVTVPNYLDRIQQTEAHFKENGRANVPEVGGLYYDVPAPGSRFFYRDPADRDALPSQNPVESTVRVPFLCEVTLERDGEPVQDASYTTLYGHGLLGTRDQVGDIKSPRRNGPFAGCAADWWGMSTADLPTVAAIIADVSNFPSLSDRAQQGFLNFMFLGRAAIHPNGFATDAAFQQDGKSLIRVADETTTPLFYDGNSQGGIMGGALVALSPDIQRGILGVPGMNYSTLLNRSVDWEGEFAELFYPSYRDPIERQLAFSLIQMLWDRAEANGFAHHMTDDPLADTPPHEVMLQLAYSDHQVANVSAEVEARTMGAPIMTPGLPDGRHWEMDPYFAETATYPYDGSALVYWDSGNATPPNGNIPPDHDGDPHGHPRSEPAAGWQEAHFLLTGMMVDVCDGGDYLTDNHPQNDGTPSCKEPSYPAGSPPPVQQEETSLSLTVDGTGSKRTLTARLTETGSGEGIAERVVDFYGDGELLGSGVTDGEGYASLQAPPRYRGGEHSFEVRFEGDDDYLPSSAQSEATPGGHGQTRIAL